MLDLAKTRNQFAAWKADEFRPAVVTASLLSAFLVYTLEIILVLSFGALVFSGPLASHLPNSLGFLLIGDALLVLIVTILGSFAGSIPASQDTPGAVLGLVAASIAAAIPSSSAAEQFATVVMMIVVTTIMTGVLFILLGVFKLGGMARFLPYPVMGGFLAGTGWLLTKGGIGIMANAPFGMEWLATPSLIHWLPGAVLGVVIYASASRFRNSFTLPIVVAVGAATFFIVAALMNISPTSLEAEGWLVGSVPSAGLLSSPFNAEILPRVEWDVLFMQLPNLAPAAIISVIGLLLNSGGMELIIKRDIDLNRELIAAGIGNLASGAMGGLVGYQAISLTALNYKLNGGKRLVGLIVAILLGGTIFFGASLLAYTPKMILGAVLVYLGVGLLVEWTYQAWFKFPKLDFAIIIAILAVIMASGFLNGILTGLVLAIILFVVNYSRIGVVRFALSGHEFHSRVTRSLRQQQTLVARGDRLQILVLQGYIFFGTANHIFEQVRGRIARLESNQVRFVLLDFGQVGGLDSTGLLSFSRMLQWLHDQKVTLVVTGLSPLMRDQFKHGGLEEQAELLRFLPDLDHGVEWCEDQLLGEMARGEPPVTNLASELEAIISGQAIERIIPYMHRIECKVGAYLVRQDDEPDMIYFIESGQVTVQLETPGQAPVRLETMHGGRMVGELGFYLGVRRTAAVVVDLPSVVYALSKRELTQIEEQDPEAANVFHRINLHLLSERAVHMTRVLNALER